MLPIARSIALLSLVAMVGCAAGRVRDPLEARKRPEKVLLTVENDRFEDARIYAVWRGGQERRLGTATGKGSQTFSFDWVDDQIQIRVSFVAKADGYTVDPITVAPGDHLQLKILDTP
jgi:hypothetical protein